MISNDNVLDVIEKLMHAISEYVEMAYIASTSSDVQMHTSALHQHCINIASIQSYLFSFQSLFTPLTFTSKFLQVETRLFPFSAKKMNQANLS
jgi:hypothetical protein